MNARRTYQIAGCALFALAALIVYHSLQLRYFTSLGPGPGFFPLWLSLILGVLALAMVLQATFGKQDLLSADILPDREGGLRMLTILAALAGVALGLETLGFSLTMFLATMVVLAVLGRRRPLGMLAIAISCSFGAYYLFKQWLNVPLPAGPFGL